MLASSGVGEVGEAVAVILLPSSMASRGDARRVLRVCQQHLTLGSRQRLLSWAGVRNAIYDFNMLAPSSQRECSLIWLPASEQEQSTTPAPGLIHWPQQLSMALMLQCGACLAASHCRHLRQDCILTGSASCPAQPPRWCTAPRDFGRIDTRSQTATNQSAVAKTTPPTTHYVTQSVSQHIHFPFDTFPHYGGKYHATSSPARLDAAAQSGPSGVRMS
jgi:hypothetical protein